MDEKPEDLLPEDEIPPAKITEEGFVFPVPPGQDKTSKAPVCPVCHRTYDVCDHWGQE